MAIVEPMPARRGGGKIRADHGRTDVARAASRGRRDLRCADLIDARAAGGKPKHAAPAARTGPSRLRLRRPPVRNDDLGNDVAHAAETRGFPRRAARVSPSAIATFPSRSKPVLTAKISSRVERVEAAHDRLQALGERSDDHEGDECRWRCRPRSARCAARDCGDCRRTARIMLVCSTYDSDRCFV